ncbi:MAG: pyridoxamine 5'-phosphate oxidase family protein [Clostridia bacterium]|nr:pyridoxamine 5'-phosphate oxidase family protein [Clostridia bacterium]
MFRELARRNKQLPQEDCLRVLETETRGVLSVHGDDGYPYGMPMNHFYNADDGCVYFHCGKAGHRLDALRRNDKASFCVYQQAGQEEGGWAWKVKSVIIFGRVEILNDWDTIVDITTRLTRRFTQDDAYLQKELMQSGPGTLLLKLTPEHMCGKLVTEK